MHLPFLSAASLTATSLLAAFSFGCGSTGSAAEDRDADLGSIGDAGLRDAPDADATTAGDADLDADLDAGPSFSADCASGELLSATLLADTTSTNGIDLSELEIADDGALFVGGELRGRATLDEGGPNETSLQGTQLGSPIVAKYSPDGELLWANVLEASRLGFVRVIRPLPDGSVIVAGTFQDVLRVGYGTPEEVILTPPPNHSNEIFIAKFGVDGETLWARQAGGGAIDVLSDLIVRNDGTFLAGGYFADAFDHTLIFPEAEGGGEKVLTAGDSWETSWMASFDEQGLVDWAQQMGGATRKDSIKHLAWSSSGTPLVAGSFAEDLTYEATNGTTTIQQTGNTSYGTQAGFLASVEPSTGLVTGLTATGGSSRINAMKANGAGDIYLVGNADRESAFDSESTTPANGSIPRPSYVLRYNENLAFEDLQIVGTGLDRANLLDIGDAFILSGSASPYRRYASGPNGEVDTTPFTDSGLPQGFLACASKTSRRVVWSTITGLDSSSAVADDGTLYVLASFRDSLTVNEGTPSEQTFTNDGSGTSVLLQFAL